MAKEHDSPAELSTLDQNTADRSLSNAAGKDEFIEEGRAALKVSQGDSNEPMLTMLGCAPMAVDWEYFADSAEADTDSDDAAYDYEEGDQHATNREKTRQRNMEAKERVAAAIAKQRAFDESRGRRSVPARTGSADVDEHSPGRHVDSKAALPIEENLEMFFRERVFSSSNGRMSTERFVFLFETKIHQPRSSDDDDDDGDVGGGGGGGDVAESGGSRSVSSDAIYILPLVRVADSLYSRTNPFIFCGDQREPLEHLAVQRGLCSA